MEFITDTERQKLLFHILGRKPTPNFEEKVCQDQFFEAILFKVFVISTPCLDGMSISIWKRASGPADRDESSPTQEYIIDLLYLRNK